MVTWEEVYSDKEIRENMEFDARYFAIEQDKRLRDKARQDALVKIMLRDTKS